MISSPVKSGRRVLLDKTTNASLTPSKDRDTQDTVKESPAKPRRDIRLLSPPPLAGHKRSIDQVDIDRNQSKSASSSFSHISREDDFYIFEENTPSSMDVDKRISFQEPTDLSGCSAKPEPKTSSQNSDCMSSMLNLSFESDGHPSKETVTKVTSPSIVPTEPNARKLFIQEKAGLLRTRLQSAMRNIKDHQIDRRLSDLEAHSRERIRMSPKGSLRSDTTSEPNNLTPKAKVPRLLPAPVLRPAAYPVLYISGTIPSSPPASASGNNESHEGMEVDDMTTPMKIRPQDPAETPALPVQLSSPPTASGETPLVINRNAMCSVEKMIAKTKKGEAVDGLLKLMKTTDEYDALDQWTG